MYSRYKPTQYSHQTTTLLKDMMASIKLPTKRRIFMEKRIRNGDPMPTLGELGVRANTPNANYVYYTCKSAKIKTNKKRSKSAITERGAYEVEKFIPIRNSIDREKEKEKLQNIFSGIHSIFEDDAITDEAKSPRSSPNSVIQSPKTRRINELMRQIQDRIEFLNTMEELGHKRTYESDIKLQISEKLAILRNLSK